ncbi:MAG: glycosyltransferase family 4 protein [Parcubacteria group bacterium]|jgi:glycosyltransferase involved in cell wall biosynthesis
MKILFFNYEYPPLGGGAANATAYILEEYSKISGLEVDLITSSIDSNYHLDKIGENIFIHRLPIGKNQNNLHYQSQKDLLVYLWKAYFFSKKLVGKNKYDLSHSFFTIPCGFISLLLRWQYEIPYIISLRGSDVPGYSDRFIFLYKFIKPLTRLIWKKSSGVIANSNDLKELALKTNLKQEIGVIPNGINISDFTPDPKKRPDGKLIITVGASRVTARKGINYLLEAIRTLISKYPEIYLKVMGDGNEKENLEKLAKELGIKKNVEFTGRIPREETFPYYQEASIFVLPSLNEGMSNAMLEALSSGLPLVATDTGGARKLLEEGVNGFIIKMKDSQDIAEKLETLAKDRELRAEMGDESRKKAETMSWEKVAVQYVKIYYEINELTN